MKFKVVNCTTAILFIFMAAFFVQTSYAAKEDAFFASSSMNIFLDNTHTKAIGMLEIGAKVYLIKKHGNWYKVKIKGWQQKGLPSVIYAFMGKRIMKAELTPNGEKLVNIMKTVKDENTELVWKKLELKGVWVNSKYLVISMNDVWKSTSTLFHERCSMCHALPKTTTFTANQWPSTLKVMTKRAALNKNQADVVSKFLQYHARDTIKLKEE